MLIPPFSAPIPPSKEVPTPKGMIGIEYSEHVRTISLTSFDFEGIQLHLVELLDNRLHLCHGVLKWFY